LCFIWKIFFCITFVNEYAACAWYQTYAGSRCFTTACSVILYLCQVDLPPLLTFSFVSFWFLCIISMMLSSIHLQFLLYFAAYWSFRKHTFNSKLIHPFCLIVFHFVCILFFLS